jgi:hypothetical protein
MKVRFTVISEKAEVIFEFHSPHHPKDPYRLSISASSESFINIYSNLSVFGKITVNSVLSKATSSSYFSIVSSLNHFLVFHLLIPVFLLVANNMNLESVRIL